jgi:hypothetical protein
MKTHIIRLSNQFPKSHPRAGQPTYFVEGLLYSLGCPDCSGSGCRGNETCRSCIRNGSGVHKLHTLRTNYDYWAPRIREVQEGKAVLRAEYWPEVPYRCKPQTIWTLTAAHGVGLQKVEFIDNNLMVIDKTIIRPEIEVAGNDGLSHRDFLDWFRGYNLSEPLAMIHFTTFRYEQ